MKPTVRERRLAARSSFWDVLPEASGANHGAQLHASRSPKLPLYDQLLHIKDWTEENAELCSDRLHHDQNVKEQLAALEDGLREDSASRLSNSERLSICSALRAAVRASYAEQDMSVRASSCSLRSDRSSFSRRRSFCRSSFASSRSIDARKRRHRQRTFVMAELEPDSSNDSHVVLMETPGTVITKSRSPEKASAKPPAKAPAKSSSWFGAARKMIWNT